MPDDFDRSLTEQEQELERCIEAARGQLPPVTTGVCQQCFTWADTLRSDLCTPCRSDNERKELMFKQ